MNSNCDGGVIASTAVVQAAGGGLSPAPSLQAYVFDVGTKREVVPFVVEHHYSHNMSGVQYKHLFTAKLAGILAGAAVFGQPAGPSCWKAYVPAREDLAELRRLVCVDNTPKNLESKFIAFCLRWLRKNTGYKKIVSYADPEHGHTGVIYRAANFEYLGLTPPSKSILFEGKTYHPKSLRAGRASERRAYSFRLKAALKSGEASFVPNVGKHIYLYTF